MKWTTEWFQKADGYFIENRKVIQRMGEIYCNHDPVIQPPENILKEVYGPLMKRVPESEIDFNKKDSDEE